MTSQSPLPKIFFFAAEIQNGVRVFSVDENGVGLATAHFDSLEDFQNNLVHRDELKEAFYEIYPDGFKYYILDTPPKNLLVSEYARFIGGGSEA